MAVLKQIKFGTGAATPIAQTVVTAASESVLSVNGTHTDLTDNNDPSYEVDLRIDNNTLVKSNDTNKVLKVGTVPAAQVSVAEGAGIEATTAQAAFKELKDKIDDVDGAAKSYKIVSVASPASTSQAEYKIQEKIGDGTWGDVTGSSTIVVPKDNAFVTAQLGHTGATVNQSTGAITDGATTGAEVLLIEYKNGKGVYTLVEIPVGDFLRESEFKNGLQVNEGEVSVKIDSTSESFLTVSADGVKLSGVQNAINAAVEALDVTDTAADGQYVSAVNETNGKVSMTRANVSDAVLNGYAKGTKPASTAIAATDDVKGAIAKLEHQIDDAKAAATTKVEKDTNASHLTLTSSTAADGSVTYTIGENDIASASDLTAEVSRAKSAETAIDTAVGLTKTASGETRTWTGTTNYGGSTASVKDNMQALDTQVKANADDIADLQTTVGAIQYKVNGTTLEFFGISEKTA